MKKHTHINTIPTKESPTSIEWDVVDKKPKVDVEVEQADIISSSFLKDTVAPTMWMVAEKIMLGMKKVGMSLKYQFHKRTSKLDLGWATQLQQKDIPWMKIGLIVFAGYVLLKKDMTFNFNLSAPFAAVADDDERNNWYAQSVANPYAPVAASALSTNDVHSFIKKYAPLAQREMELFGIPASIKLGQALIESRAGTSKLAVSNNNFFGVKCFSKNCRKGHCSNATDDHHKDFFRKYGSPKESFRAHSNLLSGSRYNSLKQHDNDYKQWAKGLKQKGYATDKTYDKKLINVIEKYELYKLDS